MPQFGLSYSGPSRAAHDFYQTEITLIQSFLNNYIKYWCFSNILKTPFNILDPCAGPDIRWGLMTRDFIVNSRPPEHIFLEAYDIQNFTIEHELQNVLYKQSTDFLSVNSLETFELADFIISNPPYGPITEYDNKKITLAEAFVRHGMKFLSDSGFMIYLLNHDFTTGVERYKDLFENYPPYVVFPCSKRPSFYGGKTSGNNYAIYVWTKDNRILNKNKKFYTELFIHDRE